jgi:ATP-dependent Clp protease ATP-binding subunit ClpA
MVQSLSPSRKDMLTKQISLSSATEHLLIKAERELRPLEHPYLGTEHLLLAIISLREGIVPSLLERLGLDARQVRHEVYSLLGHVD